MHLTKASRVPQKTKQEARKVLQSWIGGRLLRTALVPAGRSAVLAALKPEGLRAFRGGFGEVGRAVQALHDLLHVEIAGLHRLALQRELILHVFHHFIPDQFNPNTPSRSSGARTNSPVEIICSVSQAGTSL